ncbi:MAG: alkylmercury lyase family protein [Rhodothermaceae bacterium]|nr:alkylmercury lyase family protein [Rhodothermaceae bacterium]
MTELSHSRLHYYILNHVVETGFAPSIAHLADQFGQTESAVRNALTALQAYHGVVLHPHNSEVWVIHPFSMAPTNFLLRKDEMEWWGNCAWCSLGAASLLGGDVTITTTLGANSKQVQLRIKEGTLLDSGYYVHFPIPMTNAWDNVIFTCSTMLLFAEKADIETWSRRHNLPKGDIQPAEVILEFAKVWYGNHMRADWRKWTLAEAKAIFEQFNLTHRIWEMPDSEGRF